jgi:hypothetical protein
MDISDGLYIDVVSILVSIVEILVSIVEMPDIPLVCPVIVCDWFSSPEVLIDNSHSLLPEKRR